MHDGQTKCIPLQAKATIDACIAMALCEPSSADKRSIQIYTVSEEQDQILGLNLTKLCLRLALLFGTAYGVEYSEVKFMTSIWCCAKPQTWQTCLTSGPVHVFLFT